MTRDEAVRQVKNCTNMIQPLAFVNSLEALGLLHLETTEDKHRIAAAERLTGAHTRVVGAGWGKITRDGAFEILDVLIKSGFRITRDV